MTHLAYAPTGSTQRVPRPRHFLMTPPRHFAVEYAINPWMHPGIEVDRDLALRQWQTLADTYRSLGHRVDVLDPVLGAVDLRPGAAPTSSDPLVMSSTAATVTAGTARSSTSSGAGSGCSSRRSDATAARVRSSSDSSRRR